jgi:hypothetical protein
MSNAPIPLYVSPTEMERLYDALIEAIDSREAHISYLAIRKGNLETLHATEKLVELEKELEQSLDVLSRYNALLFVIMSTAIANNVKFDELEASLPASHPADNE